MLWYGANSRLYWSFHAIVRNFLPDLVTFKLNVTLASCPPVFFWSIKTLFQKSCHGTPRTGPHPCFACCAGCQCGASLWTFSMMSVLGAVASAGCTACCRSMIPVGFSSKMNNQLGESSGLEDELWTLEGIEEGPGLLEGGSKQLEKRIVWGKLPWITFINEKQTTRRRGVWGLRMVQCWLWYCEAHIFSVFSAGQFRRKRGHSKSSRLYKWHLK